jgi:tetratricopeptide (TPR) repeat protein
MSKSTSAENLSKQLTCPLGTCQSANVSNAEFCERCGLPLQAFARVSAFPSILFNMGLSKAKEKQISEARDLFAAVVYWCPKDVEARNAFAMACFVMEDYNKALNQWEIILKQSPSNILAKRGLLAIDSAIERSKKLLETTEKKNLTLLSTKKTEISRSKSNIKHTRTRRKRRKR